MCRVSFLAAMFTPIAWIFTPSIGMAGGFCQRGGCPVPVVVNTPAVALQTNNVQIVDNLAIVSTPVVPVAIPVLVPAAVFQYLPPVSLPAAYAPGVSQSEVPMARAEAGIVDVDRLVRERVDAILRERGLISAGLPVAKEWSTVTTTPAPVSAALSNSTLAELGNKCFRCHRADISKGGVALFDYYGGFRPNVERATLRNAVISGKMPPSVLGDPNHPSGLSVSARNNIRSWAAQQ